MQIFQKKSGHLVVLGYLLIIYKVILLMLIIHYDPIAGMQLLLRSKKKSHAVLMLLDALTSGQIKLSSNWRMAKY